MEKDILVVVDELLSQIKITSNTNNKPVTISGNVHDLSCIGIGTDAAVFQYVHEPSYAFKLYADEKRDKIQTEAKVYKELNGSPYFSKCFGAYDRYLVLSFESGITLYDCLLQGIHIPSQAITDVEDARIYAQQQNLNPRDIHLKNILLQNGRAKVIDVSEYLKPGNDHRWEHLKKAYDEYYHLVDGKAIPIWLLETIQRWYNQRNNSSIEEFIKDVLKLKVFWK
ncbi:serine/threonine protein kinase [Metabacillus halosaccharovorans]|uniref:serine/threonine protein kinase n=1 Tax=Metabacillus halosaccharovorans TaxID=930124 RepID=UPI00204182CD|nr:serine/threonine protein kinase [Metabacillus halosaccharovorans]MCM3439722.1 serine/threonine protein kinase [Metabacillus halosaccharovorans]